MASRVRVILEDDLDGRPADETVTFALDGVRYEIDLASDHANQLRDDLAPWVSSARRTGGRKIASPARSARRADLDDIRRWGRAQGWQISDRGRVPQNIVEAYDQAHP